MDFKQYQEESKKTAIYPKEIAPLYPLLGMLGEVAETVDKATSTFHIDINTSIASQEDIARLDRMGELVNAMIMMGAELEGIKKHFRKNGLGEGIFIHQDITEEQRTEIGKELGDQLWYHADACGVYGLCMDDVATTNIQKLQSRQQRNVLEGNGDNR